MLEIQQNKPKKKSNKLIAGAKKNTHSFSDFVARIAENHHLDIGKGGESIAAQPIFLQFY